MNLYVAFNFDQDIWVNFKVFGLTGLMFIFSIGSVLSLSKYLQDDEDESEIESKQSVEDENNQ